MNFNLFQFIVPLAFLAMWALTYLFNREAQPLPPRVGGRPFDPNGPRPQAAPAGGVRPTERKPPATTLEASDRWQTGANPNRPSPASRPAGRDDGIVILETETRRPPQGSASRPPTVKRNVRPKSGSAPASKRAEPTPPRTLSGSIAPPMTPLVSRPVELKPLTLPASPLLSAPGQPITKSSAISTESPRVPDLSATDLRRVLSSPARIRESLIVGELLRPPLALRGQRRGSS